MGFPMRCKITLPATFENETRVSELVSQCATPPPVVGIGLGLNPVSTCCSSYHPSSLPDLETTFWFEHHGGIDVQQILPFATPERVREEVKRIVAILGHGGSYILAPSHNIQADVPPENVLAMYEAFQ